MISVSSSVQFDSQISFTMSFCYSFYLNYALSSNDAFIDFDELKRAEKKAREIIEKNCGKDWDKRQKIIFF